MSIQLTPIAAAMVLLFAGQAYADGGAAGANGVGSMIGSESVGNVGAEGANANGQDGDSFAGPFTINTVPSGSSGAGQDGQPPTNSSVGGGGAGGNGGGSVFGGISTGGAAGGYASGAPSSANGGNGGNVSSNTIEITNSTLTGAVGGAGSSITSSRGGGGVGGQGGGSVFGGISIGGAAGSASSANGGNGGDVRSNTIEITNSTLIGAAGGAGGSTTSSYGAGGVAGNGGGSVFGGISIGGAAGSGSSANGGNGGGVTNNHITLKDVKLNGTGATGGEGGSLSSYNGGGGVGGQGGGSVFGGISIGGAASSFPSAIGGNGGDVSSNTIEIIDSTLTGAAGGAGGSISASSSSYGGGGVGGHGGGSVFGGISTGGSGGYSTLSANGGNGGSVSSNTIEITNSTLTGAAGGVGGSLLSTNPSYGGGGAAGHGGGSVFGGISTGGAAGTSSAADTSSANGGNGGSVSSNTIEITNSTLIGAAGGAGGSITSSSSSFGGGGAAGYGGGSVFGGISTGGAGGISTVSTFSANGGNGGDVLNNKITISGNSMISGDIYGGISQGGSKGFSNGNALDGKGGLVQNNTVTIIGDNVSITGSLYGGLSIDGDGSPNLDADYSRYYAGNTLVMQSGDFQLNGSIKNFQNYNWLIPQNELNGDVIITVVSGKGTAVDISNTVHSVDVQATGNVLNAGDQVTLITDVIGQPKLKPTGKSSSRGNIYIEQGFFIFYDAEMVTQSNGAGGNALVLNVLDVRAGPDGSIHPESEEFLKGRMAQLAIVDQGADMISDGISYARASLRKSNANLFAIVDGGSNKYKNGGVSTLNINDFKFALGAAKAWEFNNKSSGMIAAFAEHGNGNFNSYNYFDYFGDTRGSGKVRYSGVGLMGHMDVAGTDVSKVKNKPNIFDDKYGLYLDAALRTGHVKVDFHSADMEKGAGIEARYNTKSRYASAMLGVGYVWTLDAKSAMDFYARYTYSRLNGKDIQVIDEQMNAGAAHSKRLRLGARYGYAYSATTTPYAGLAFERNFTGDVTGSAYGFTIKENSLKGNTGIVEAGVTIKPKGADDPFSLRFGVQGYFGQRKGASAAVRARYVF